MAMAEVTVEESGDLAERFPGLRHPIIELVLRVRLTLVDFELRIDAGVTKLAVYAHGIAQQQISCPSGQDRGREAVHISIDRREQWILEIMSAGVDDGAGVAKSIAGYQDVVDHLIRVEGVAGLRDIRHRGTWCNRTRQPKPLPLRPQHH